MQAVQYRRSRVRVAAARLASTRLPAVATGDLAPVSLVTTRPPALPGPGWSRVRPLLSGICGSDLATVSGRSSLYLSAVVSTPFVLGHEVLGEMLDDGTDARGETLRAGRRVVLDPVLACATRGLAPCPGCATGRTDRCDGVTTGHLSPGLQTGFCADTGGGWSEQLVAHASQLHAVPDALPDEAAVLAEPLACAVHTAQRARLEAGDHVLVVGAGAVGLLAVLALRRLHPDASVTVVAKHAAQSRRARELGADDVVTPDAALARVRRRSRALRLEPERGASLLLGGADVALDCAGSRASLDLALRATRAGGRVVLSGMPASGVDLTPLWFRELELVGTYASPAVLDEPGGTSRRTFDVALELADDPRLEGFVDAGWPLERWREAVDAASDAGRLGTVKTALDLRRTA